MSCPTPFFRKMSDGSVVALPCGYCAVCRVDRRNEWTWRIKAEIADKPAMFVTLTISDEYLVGRPRLYDGRQLGPSLMVKSTKNFWKRLRKCTGKDLKYVCVGEYGSSDGRPHYHAIIIGLSCGKSLSYDEGDIPSIRKCWKFGFISAEPASIGSIRYILKYMDKMLSPSEWSKLYPDLLRPFKTQSQGFGLKWIIDNKDTLLEYDGKFFFDGKWRPLPRYYKEKLGLSVPNRDDYSSSSLEAMLIRSPKKKSLVMDYCRRFDCSVEDALFALGKQTLINFRSHENVDNKYL